MRKIASHYLITHQLFRFHTVLLENGQLTGVSLLEQEEAGVEFYNGLIWILPAASSPEDYPWQIWAHQSPDIPLKQLILQHTTERMLPAGQPIHIFHFPDLTLPASEFRTDHSGCNCHIQRL